MNAFQFGCAVKSAMMKQAAGTGWGPEKPQNGPMINTPDGPGRLLRTQTLPKSDATARNWQGAPAAPPATSPAFQGSNGSAPPTTQPQQAPPMMRPVSQQFIRDAQTDYGRLPLRSISQQQVQDAQTDHGRLPLRSIPQPQQPPTPAPAQQAQAPAAPAQPASPPAQKPNEWLKMVKNMNNSVMPKTLQLQ